MSRKIILLPISIIFFLKFNLAFAGVLINEIMYAPSAGASHEWLEIYNQGSEPVDLTDWRFFNSESDSAPLRIQTGSAILSAGAYAIITKTSDGFTSDWPAFSGTIFTSSQFSLPDDSSKNSSYKAISNSDKQIIDTVTYDTSLGGSKDSGNSLSKINGAWLGGTPSPGEVNVAAVLKTDNDTGNGGKTTDTSSTADTNSNDSTADTGASSSGGGGSTSVSMKKGVMQKFKVSITAKPLAFVGLPVTFEGTAFGHSGEQLISGKYFWNFGDGDSKEIFANGSQKFTHTYRYWGEYTVSLEYYTNYYADAPDASDKIVIKVVPAEIAISSVGDERDFFVELSNNTSYDADVSNWILAGSGKIFTMPRNTTIGAKKKIMLSSMLTNFSIQDKNTLKLMTPEGGIVADYMASITHSVSSAPVTSIASEPQKTQKISTEEKNAPAQISAANPDTMNDLKKTDPEEKISVENLPDTNIESAEVSKENLAASVVSSDGVQNSDKAGENNPYSAIILAGSVLFIGAAAYAVYYIRRKKVVVSSGSDFEILDE